MIDKLTILVVTILILTSCVNKGEKIIEYWDNNEAKKKKVYLNSEDTSLYLILLYYKDGQLKECTPYIAETKNGWSITYHQNGHVKDSIFYRNNTPTTTTQKFYSNGKLAHEGEYNEVGKQTGLWIYYDSLGRLFEQTEFIGNGGKAKTFYFDSLGWMIKEIRFQEGTIGLVDEELNYKDSTLNGPYFKYFENENIMQAGKYINGARKKTTWTDFFISGKKHREYLFTNEGEFSIRIINLWNENGVQTVKEGNGKSTTYEYCANGKPKTKVVTYYFKGVAVKVVKKKLIACH